MAAIMQPVKSQEIQDQHKAKAKKVEGFYSDQDILILRDALLNERGLKIDSHSIWKAGYRTYFVPPFVGIQGLDGLKEIICIALLNKLKNKQILFPYRMKSCPHWVTMRILIKKRNTVSLDIYDSGNYYKGKEDIETALDRFFSEKKEFSEFLLNDKRIEGVTGNREGLERIFFDSQGTRKIYFKNNNNGRRAIGQIQFGSDVYCGGYTARLIINLTLNPTSRITEKNIWNCNGRKDSELREEDAESVTKYNQEKSGRFGSRSEAGQYLGSIDHKEKDEKQRIETKKTKEKIISELAKLDEKILAELNQLTPEYKELKGCDEERETQRKEIIKKLKEAYKKTNGKLGDNNPLSYFFKEKQKEVTEDSQINSDVLFEELYKAFKKALVEELKNSKERGKQKTVPEKSVETSEAREEDDTAIQKTKEIFFSCPSFASKCSFIEVQKERDNVLLKSSKKEELEWVKNEITRELEDNTNGLRKYISVSENRSTSLQWQKVWEDDKDKNKYYLSVSNDLWSKIISAIEKYHQDASQQQQQKEDDIELKKLAEGLFCGKIETLSEEQEKILSRKPNTPITLSIRSEIFRRQNKLSEALDCLKGINRVEKENLFILYVRGLIYLQNDSTIPSAALCFVGANSKDKCPKWIKEKIVETVLSFLIKLLLDIKREKLKIKSYVKNIVETLCKLLNVEKIKEREVVDFFIGFLDDSRKSELEPSSKKRSLFDNLIEKIENQEGIEIQCLIINVLIKLPELVNLNTNYLESFKNGLENHIQKNHLNALNCYKKSFRYSAKQDALNNLVKKNILKIEEFYLADKNLEGYADAMYAIADLYEQEVILPKNLEKSFKYYKLAEEAGSVNAMLRSDRERDFDRDGLVKKIIFYQKLLDEDNREKQLLNKIECFLNKLEEKLKLTGRETSPNDKIRELAKIYESGNEVKKNNEKAIEWYKEAIKNRDTDVHILLGDLYLSEKQYKKAFLWYCSALEKGHKDAEGKIEKLKEKLKKESPDVLLEIASFYEVDKKEEEEIVSVKRNYKEAIGWYLLALDNGSKDAQEKVKKLSEKINDKEDQFLFGEIYKKRGELEVAVSWFIKAAKQGNTQAYELLENMIGKKEYLNIQKLIGDFYKEKKEFEKAMQCYEALLDQALPSSSSLAPPPSLSSPLSSLSSTLSLVPVKTVKLPSEITVEVDYGSDEDADEQDILASVEEEPCLPEKQNHPISIFYQNDMSFSLNLVGKKKLNGYYFGTVGGLELMPNGFGSFRFSEKNGDSSHEIFYKGEWHDGQWHKGYYKEVFKSNNMETSVEISNAYFVKGKLCSEDGCSDSHITVVKTIAGKKVEIHYYGQMKQGDNPKNILTCLTKMIIANHFCFHSNTARGFKKVGQLQILSHKNYELIGYWNEQTQKLEKVFKNDLLSKKLKILEDIKAEVRENILKSNEFSRYSMIGFYFEVIKKSMNLISLVENLLKQNDEDIVPISVKNLSQNVKDILDLIQEIRGLIDIEENNEIVSKLKEEVEKYIKGEYLKWIQGHDIYDADSIGKAYLTGDVNIEVLLCLNPDILKMISNIRKRISGRLDVSPYFKLSESELNEREKQKDLIIKFVSCWGRRRGQRGYFDPLPEDSFFQLIQYDYKNSPKKYLNKMEGFKTRAKQIEKASKDFERCFNYYLVILDKLDNSTMVEGRTLKEFCKCFSNNYFKSVLNYRFHLEPSNIIVNYIEKHNEVIRKEIESFKEKHSKNFDGDIHKEITEFLDSIIRAIKSSYLFNINHILNTIEYVLKIKDILKDKLFNKDISEIVRIQLGILSNSSDLPSDSMRRLISVFSSFLEKIKNLSNSSYYKHFLKNLENIKKSVLEHFSAVLSKIKTSIREKEIAIMCDFVEKQSTFLGSIVELPLFLREKDKETEEFGRVLGNSIKERGSQGVVKIKPEKLEALMRIQKRPHYSYEILQETLKILSEIKESLKFPLDTFDKYYDCLGEQIKQFEKQIEFNDLDKHKGDAIDRFNHCKMITSLEALNDYLDVLKKFITMKGNQKEISTEKAIEYFLKLNPDLKENKELLERYNLYVKKFEAFRTSFYQKKIGIKNIVAQLNVIVSGNGKEGKIVEGILTILAGLSFTLTVRVSKICNGKGEYSSSQTDKSIIELSPHIIQILGCMRFLQLHKVIDKKSIKEWLDTIPKQVGEVLTGQGKSWQISLLAALYALFGYQITVACYSEYLSERDNKDFMDYFQDIEKVLDKVKFKTLERLACDEIENDCESEETIGSLVEQIIFKGQYDGERYNRNFLPSEVSGSEKSDDHIVIVDEVDTLISTELNNSVNRISVIRSEKLAEAVEELYQAAKGKAEKGEEVVAGSSEMGKFEAIARQDPGIESLAKNRGRLFDSYKEDLLYSVNRIASYYSGNHERQKEAEKYLLESNYLDSSKNPFFRLKGDGSFWEYFNGTEWSSYRYPYYHNAFFYLELFSKSEKHKGTKMNYKAYGYLKLSCGSIYYSSVVSKMTNKLMLGVTGSIMTRKTDEGTESCGELLLSLPEQTLLGSDFLGVEKYNITHFPSFFGSPRIVFKPDDINHFLIIEKEESWYETIVERCLSLSSKGKAVLVFLEEPNQIEKLFNTLIEKAKEPYVLTNDLISVNESGTRKDSKGFYKKSDLGTTWQKAINRLISEYCVGQAGQISLVIKNYGRGTDFKASESANKEGGLHVIQCWFSKDRKEEVQVKGRTGRNGAPGVYVQILCLEHLRKTFNIESSDQSIITSYQLLKEKAKEIIVKDYSNVKSGIDEHGKKSNDLLTWLRDARIDRAKKLSNGYKDVDKSLIEKYFKIG